MWPKVDFYEKINLIFNFEKKKKVDITWFRNSSTKELELILEE